MSMTKRLSKIEKEFETNAKYRGCELIQVVFGDNPVVYYCQYSDGHRELITDKNIIDELADIPGDGISVVVVE